MAITERQIAALRYLIAKACLNWPNETISRLVRQLMWRLISASEGMTKAVFITLRQETGDFTPDEINEIAWAAGGFNSANLTTHLGALLALMGTDFVFSLQYGAYDAEGKFNTDGQFPSQDGHHEAPIRYTFWLDSMPYLEGRGVDRVEVPVTRAELEAIDLTQDGLYS